MELLAAAPGEWTPIAGGIEIMVAHAAGRLGAKKLVSLWGIDDLRFIKEKELSITIGAAATFRFERIRESRRNCRCWPKLRTGCATLPIRAAPRSGGNIINGSPAADSSPALLVYDAEIELASVRGRRRFPYSAFHRL